MSDNIFAHIENPSPEVKAMMEKLTGLTTRRPRPIVPRLTS